MFKKNFFVLKQRNKTHLRKKFQHCYFSVFLFIYPVCFSICTSPYKEWLFTFVFLLTTLNTHFIWPFSVSISFKQSKHALNIDSNGHQKTKKLFKNVSKQQKHSAKNMFLHLYQIHSTALCWLKQLISPKLNAMYRLQT